MPWVLTDEVVLRFVLANIPHSVFWKDREGVFLGCNEQLVREAGLGSADELIGKTDYDMAWAEQADAYRHADRAVMESGVPLLNIEEPQRRPNGELRWLLTSKVPMQDAAGRVRGILGIYTDITDRKRMEQFSQRAFQTLRESEQRIGALLRHLPVIVFAIDRAGVFTFSDGSGLSLLGSEPGKAIGRSAWEMYADHPTIGRNLKAALAGESFSDLVRVGEFLLETFYSPSRDEAGAVVGAMGLAIDVTERERREEAQHRAEAAEQKSADRAAFLANMSHELRTPLNSILGFAGVLASTDYGPLSERQQRYVQNIVQSGQHMLSLVNDLLDLRRLEVMEALELRPVSVRDTLAEAVRMISPQTEQRQLVVQTELETAGLQARADARALLQIFLNLLSNAAKFASERGRISIRGGRDRVEIWVEVSDNGIGIAEEDQPHLFEYFFQVGGKQRHHMKGSGIGLSLTKSLLDRMAGRITVRSRLGEGATFRIVLPEAT